MRSSFEPADSGAVVEFWEFFEPRSSGIAEDVRRAMARLPAWQPVLDAITADQVAAEERRHRALQRAAIVDGQWAPYLATLHELGQRCAHAGIGFPAWLQLIAAFRDAIQLRLAADGHAVAGAARGLTQLLDLVTEHVGVGYLGVIEQVIDGSEERYRSMFEHSPLPMWMFDRETLAFVEVNDAAVRHYGYSRAELLTMTLADIRPPEDVAALRDDVRHAVGAVPAKVWRHRKKDGSIIMVEIRANDFRLAGRPVRLVLVNDITEQERGREALARSQDQLRQAQKMDAIGRLAGGVAHDFNNLLTIVGSYAALLEESLPADDTRREDAIEIGRAATRATEITRQLLTLSRHGIATPRSVQLDQVVVGFVPMLRRALGSQIALVVHRADAPPVLADPGQLEQILMNLAVNARDAMPDGGRLTIETRTTDLADAAVGTLPAGTYVVLAVTDTGCGMDADTQRRLFEPFFTTKEVGKGTGLGLSIVHGIVAQAGGAISVYSEPDHGTAFRIHLPVATRTVLAPVAEVFALPRPLPPMTVLVVDDDLAVRGVAARILQDAGARVLEAASADECRRVVVSHEGVIDLVLLDVILPDGRGDRLADQLRELRPAMRVVLASGYPAGALSPSGAAPPELLTKPYTPTDLRAAVARAIEGAPGQEPTGGAVPVPAARVGPRVLLAEDDPILRGVVARVLRRADCEVVETDGGVGAIEQLDSARFDVVLSDVHMPGGGGMEVLRGVRRIDLDVPVILMSGMPSVGIASQALEYGAFRYLTKPLDFDGLGKLVHHAARTHAMARLRREAYAMRGGHAGAVDRAGLEVRFTQAMGDMWMDFQPIVEAATGRLYGVEALLRSNEPSLPGPQQVLDAAAELGTLALLGRRVRTLAAAAFGPRLDGLQLFVNLHPDDLLDIDLVDLGAPLTPMAARVILEVTERASLASSTELTRRVERLRELGFRIAIDDIGAGYSGLTSFAELVPEVVKIDMTLVRGVHLSALKQRTIAALCKLCHEGNCLVVGEGVETLEERDCLIALGCDLLQGYLIARPSRALPPEG